MTKVIAFSVPSEFEAIIQKAAKAEHRTLSEYIREAIRHYIVMDKFEKTHVAVKKRLKAKGLKPKDVDKAIKAVRK